MTLVTRRAFLQGALTTFAATASATALHRRTPPREQPPVKIPPPRAQPTTNRPRSDFVALTDWLQTTGYTSVQEIAGPTTPVVATDPGNAIVSHPLFFGVLSAARHWLIPNHPSPYRTTNPPPESLFANNTPLQRMRTGALQLIGSYAAMWASTFVAYSLERPAHPTIATHIRLTGYAALARGLMHGAINAAIGLATAYPEPMPRPTANDLPIDEMCLAAVQMQAQLQRKTLKVPANRAIVGTVAWHLARWTVGYIRHTRSAQPR